MKKRYLYALMFGAPGLIAAGWAAVLATGAGAGAAWLFLFGDNPWPEYVEAALVGLFAGVFLTVWLGCAGAGFLVGRRLEDGTGVNRRHVWAAVMATVIPLLLMAVGAAGEALRPRTESERCFEFCRENGYTASSTPPEGGERMCGCLDEMGVEGLRAPMEELEAGR